MNKLPNGYEMLSMQGIIISNTEIKMYQNFILSHCECESHLLTILRTIVFMICEHYK